MDDNDEVVFSRGVMKAYEGAYMGKAEVCHNKDLDIHYVRIVMHNHPKNDILVLPGISTESKPLIDRVQRFVLEY